jgi:hypothetical protein
MATEQLTGSTALREPSLAGDVRFVRLSVCDAVEHERGITAEHETVCAGCDDGFGLGSSKEQHHFGWLENVPALEFGGCDGCVLVDLARYDNGLDTRSSQRRKAGG